LPENLHQARSDTGNLIEDFQGSFLLLS